MTRAILTIIMPFLALHWLPAVFIDVFLIATASCFFNPAKQAILPNLVPNVLLVRANSLVVSSERAMELVGFSAAGAIAATISWIPLFIIDSGTYLFSAMTLLGVPDSLRRAGRRQLRMVQDVTDGLRFIGQSSTLRSTMAISAMGALFGGMTYPTLIVLAYGALQAGPSGYGFLEAAIGGGAIIGAVAAPHLILRYNAGVLILVGVVGVGASYAITGWLRSLGFALVFLFACGVASSIYLLPLISVTQREAPDHIRGRVMSSRFILTQAGLLGGMALAGPLSDSVGAPIVFILSGVLLMCTAGVGFAFKNLRNATLRDYPLKPELKATAAG